MKSSRTISDLYRPSAKSLKDAMLLSNANAGFKIPEYQREYNWDKGKIKRLFEDCGNGFYSLSRKYTPTVYTFLGTLILVSDNEKEGEFDGESLCVVDGQQRLTTLLLTCVALIEEIFGLKNEIGKLKNSDLKRWLTEEVQLQSTLLYRSIAGSLTDGIENYPYPRLVRHNDIRAKDYSKYVYNSVLSDYLFNASSYYRENYIKEQPPKLGFKFEKTNVIHSNFLRNVEHIKKQVQLITSSTIHASLDKDSQDADVEQLSPSDFKNSSFRDLFGKLEVLESQSKVDKVMSLVAKGTSADDLIRTLLFSSYILNFVVFTLVQTDDDGAAFEIFDSLNTTGEPLTAVETFKPQVMNFENHAGKSYSGSKSQSSYENLERLINSFVTKQKDNATVTKELLVSFALILDATKLPSELSAQRLYLRSFFNNIDKEYKDSEKKQKGLAKRKVVTELENLAIYRSLFWGRNNIEKINSSHLKLKPLEIDTLKLCLCFLSDLNHTLTIPILCRFWSDNHQNSPKEFLTAVKAMTAFTIFRRAVTGRTKNIDSDFRSVMSLVDDNGHAMSLGNKVNNKLVTSETLKKKLRALLLQKTKFDNKDKWLSLVKENEIIGDAKKVVKFMILAAAHNSELSSDPVMLNKSQVRNNPQKHYLDFKHWAESDLYETVEHVAPSSIPETGWPDDVYRPASIRQKLGNATLLPRIENSILGNRDWASKKRLFLALLSGNLSELSSIIDEFEKTGKSLKKKTKETLKKGSKLTILDTISSVDEWNKEVIDKRTENIASLCWDEICDWLY